MSDRLRPFSQALKENSIGLTTGYKHVREGRLTVVKVGRKTYVRDADWAAFVASLPTLGRMSKPTPATTTPIARPQLRRGRQSQT
jgi:hypothetical protein